MNQHAKDSEAKIPQPKKQVRKPLLLPSLRLRCPYCAKTPLLKTGAWFTFANGCPDCDYRFERELGYFAGASWLINFPVVSVSGFILAGFLLAWGLSVELIAALVGVYMIAFGAVFTPFSMALWLYFEHRLHPLNPGESLTSEAL